MRLKGETPCRNKEIKEKGGGKNSPYERVRATKKNPRPVRRNSKPISIRGINLGRRGNGGANSATSNVEVKSRFAALISETSAKPVLREMADTQNTVGVVFCVDGGLAKNRGFTRTVPGMMCSWRSSRLASWPGGGEGLFSFPALQFKE